MIILASSSPTRAKILNEYDIEFEQKSCNFNEENIKTTYLHSEIDTLERVKILKASL